MAERADRTARVRCSPETVYGALCDAALLGQRSALTGRTTVLRHEVNPAGLSLQVATEVPLDWVPMAIRSGLTGRPQIVRSEDWELLDEVHLVGAQRFHVTDAAARGEGRTEVTWTGDGSRLTSYLEVRVSLPLVGGIVEKAILPSLQRGLDAEVAWYDGLAESPG